MKLHLYICWSVWNGHLLQINVLFENWNTVMASGSDSEMFITQSRYSLPDNVPASNVDTDVMLSDILDLQNEQPNIVSPNFDVRLEMFSDISDAELIHATQEVEEQLVGRFKTPLQEADLNKMVKDSLSSKTLSKSKWAVNVFKQWQEERKKQAALDNSIRSFEGDIITMTNDVLNEALGYFVAEVTNKDGNEYRPNTIYELIISIQHFLRNNGRFVRFLDDAEFQSMRQILDAKMKNPSRQGIGANKRQADVITEEQENILWENGILGSDNPEQLLDTLIFQLGLNFALRAGQEHRNLRHGSLSQVQVKTDLKGKKYLEYAEDVSKTNTGGLAHRKVQQKVTRAYENNDTSQRCPVRIYEKYISLR